MLTIRKTSALCLLLSWQAAVAQQLKRNEIAAAYLFNFAKNIEWRDESRLSGYHFLIISDDNAAARELSNRFASKKLKGKPIRLTASESLGIPDDVQLVFLARGLNDLALHVFRRIEGRNVLLVTDGLDDRRYSMINLVETEDNTIRFEINKANILNQGLRILPEMVLLGGTEIDVAKLYKETRDTLRVKEERIAAQRLHLDSLNGKIEAAYGEIEKQGRLIAQQKLEIVDQKGRLEIQRSRLEEQRNRLEEQSKLLDGQRIRLAIQRARLDEQRDSLKRQAASLDESRLVLARQQREIESGKAILSVQQAEIDRQTAAILKQKRILEEQHSTIAVQKSIQRLLILIIVLALGLTFTVYRSYQSKKRSNGQLREQKDKLQETLAQLEAARDKARQYLDVAGVVMVALDAGRRVTMINRKGCEVLGLPMEEIVGKDWFDSFVPDKVRRGHLRAFHRFLAGEAGPFGYSEIPVLTRENGERLIAWHNVPLKDENGNCVGTLGSGEDITGKKRAERQIERLNRDLLERAAALENANKELEAFSYSVSHDLRAPLRSIDGFSQAIIEDYGDAIDGKGKDYLRRVRSAAQRMGNLIDDLLELSRVTRNEMVLHETDLSGMAAGIAENLRRRQPLRKAEFIIQPGITAIGDERLLRIALENLLDNAWKYTSRRPEARIEFGWRMLDGKAVCFVRDDGAGFDMKYAKKLFGAFQRLHTEQEFPGTGVGLATVQRIIRRHGGEIWAESEPGKGATFYFSLPGKEFPDVPAEIDSAG